jgi:hypothetical protein
LGSMSSLQQLQLHANQLSGCIPDELSNLNLFAYPIGKLFLFGNDDLLGWETQAGLDWALSLGSTYWGPETVCP